MSERKVAGLLLAGGLLGAMLVMPLPTVAAMSADQVSAKITKVFSVKVLRTRPGQADGRRVYVVTIMNPGADFNTAFQVNTLIVDADTGKLVSGFRHRASGYDPNPAPSFIPNLNSPDTLSWGFVWR